MTDFGDVDPEDAYDAGDRTADRLDVLHRIVATLEQLPVGGPHRVWRIADTHRLLDGIPRHRAEVRHLRDRLMAIR